MKAIINVNRKSVYSKLNGLTFDVKDVMSNLISLDINGIITDFTHKEVMIVDFANELQSAYNRANWNSSDMTLLFILRSYKIDNNIGDTQLEYNCPA